MKGRITGATKVSYDTGIQPNKYPDYSSSVPAGTQSGVQPQTDATPVANGQGTLDTVFTTPEAGTPNAGVSTADDLFRVDSNADTEALAQQQTQVSTAVTNAEESHGNVSTEIEKYEARIEQQNERIENLSKEIEQLKIANDVLESVNRALLLHSNMIQAKIEKLDTQIEANSGILGTIANGINSLFGNGIDVKALKEQKADLEATKAQIDAQIEANNAEMNSNSTLASAKSESKDRTEACKAKNEEHAEALREKLGALEEKIQNGTATLEEIEAAIKAANEESGINASDEDVKKAALVIMDSGNKQGNTDKTGNLDSSNDILSQLDPNSETQTKNGEELETSKPSDKPLNPVDKISDFLNSADETGKCDNKILVDIFEDSGMNEHEARERVEFLDTIASYEEIGVDIDIADLSHMTAAQLDLMVETAIIQDVIKSTSTKVMGSAINISSKKEMQENSEATNDFIENIDALNSYYNANDATDFEVKAFLSLGGTMRANISQGYVYDTSSLQGMSNDAQMLLTSLKTQVNTNANLNNSSDTQFMQERTKTSDILDDTEKALGKDSDTNNKLAECKIEFLNLTSGYNNAESDSEQTSYIKLMQELGEKSKRIKENPESQNPYLDNSLWIAA